MSRLFRCALLASAAFSYAAASYAPARAQAPAPPSPTARDRIWAQSYSDLSPDPAIRFGALPNGMRYALMHNDTPTHQVSLRLRVGSGSLEETDAQQGLAHLLEHTAFNGSTHVQKGEMVKMLQRLGLGFGADTNASTQFTQTVYEFDLPESDATTVGTGLMLMREIAGELTISQSALNTERGVVLSEERLRDTPNYEAMKARLGFAFKDQLVSHRLPIGQVDIIQNAPASLLRSYYEANYQPDRTTLIVVGDIDPNAIEAQIKARFADWRPAAAETPPLDYGSPLKREPQTQLTVRAGVTPTLSIDWVAPYDPTPDTYARERRDLVERIALMVLNQRYLRLAHGAHPPFLQAGAFRENFERSAKPTTLQVVFQAQDWRSALDAAVATQRQALLYGVRQDEVDREVTEYRVQLQGADAGAATRRTPDLANELVRTVDEQEVDTSPAADLILFDRATKSLTAAEVGEALRHAFTGSGPLLTLDEPLPVEGGEAAVASAFKAAVSAPVPPPASAQARTWTHTRFGRPGRVVEQTTVPDLGLTFVRFANGVRLTIKPTAFRKDQTLVSVSFGHGRLALPKDRDAASWAAAAFVPGGLKDLSYEDVQQVLASKSVSIGLTLEDNAFAFSGVTRPQDLAVQLQLIAAYMTEPGWRPEAIAQTRSELGVALDALPSTPQGVESRDLAALEHSGDARWRVPTPAQVRSEPVAPFRSVMEHALTAGPLEVEIVGDVSVPEAIAAAASTFGALPERATDAVAPGEDRVAFPTSAATPVLRTHTGRSDQAIAFIGWPTVDLISDPQKAREVNITAEVLGSRLIDQVRIAEGATYSPASRGAPSETFPGYGYAYASVETPPAKIERFYANVARITADMAARGITADELERAKAPRLEQLAKAQETNEYWLARLQDAQTDPRRLTIIRDTLPGYRRVTADDVRRTAATYLSERRAWRFEIEPVNPAPTAGADAAALPAPEPRAPGARPQSSGPALPGSGRSQGGAIPAPIAPNSRPSAGTGAPTSPGAGVP